MREAVVGFFLLKRTWHRHGGVCKTTFRQLEAISPELHTHMSHVLAALKKKGVLEDYSYDNRGTGYFSANVKKEFAEAVRRSRYYSMINLYDFNMEAAATMSLSDKVFYQVAKYMDIKFGIRYASTIAKFVGMSKNSVLAKMKGPMTENRIWVDLDKKSKCEGDLPYIIRGFDDKDTKKSDYSDEFIQEMKLCLWRYENSESTLYRDKNDKAVLIKGTSPKYTAVITDAKRIFEIPDDEEIKARRHAVRWLKRNGPGTPRYEELRKIFDVVESITGDDAIHAVNIRLTEDSNLDFEAVRRRVFLMYDASGEYYIPMRIDKTKLTLGEDKCWHYQQSPVPAPAPVVEKKEEPVVPEETEEDLNKLSFEEWEKRTAGKSRLVTLDDLF